jgi:hypothetical protein
MTIRKTRNDTDLQGASGHLQYEVWMFMELAGTLATGRDIPLVVKNALLEAFTVHARVLLNVFYPAKPRLDDVLASDYFDDPGAWERERPPLSPTLQMVDGRVGKEVAHLTYARLAVTPEQKLWPFIEIARDMARVVIEFDRLAPVLRLGSQWREYAKVVGLKQGA